MNEWKEAGDSLALPNHLLYLPTAGNDLKQHVKAAKKSQGGGTTIENYSYLTTRLASIVPVLFVPI